MGYFKTTYASLSKRSPSLYFHTGFISFYFFIFFYSFSCFQKFQNFCHAADYKKQKTQFGRGKNNNNNNNKKKKKKKKKKRNTMNCFQGYN